MCKIILSHEMLLGSCDAFEDAFWVCEILLGVARCFRGHGDAFGVVRCFRGTRDAVWGHEMLGVHVVNCDPQSCEMLLAFAFRDREMLMRDATCFFEP